MHLQQGSYPQAQEHLQALRQQQPTLDTPLTLLEAETLYQQGLFALAAHCLNRALAITPDQVPLRYARAMQRERQQQLDLAEEDLRHILALEPDHTQALNALGYLLADRNKQLDEARQLVSRALALAPEDPAIIDSMGWVEYRSGNLSAAIALLQRAFKLSGDAEVAAHLGEALWMNGDETQARQLWQQVLQNKPNEPHPVLRSTLQRFKVDLP